MTLGILLLGALLIVLAALQARDAARDAWVRSWVLQAEDLGAFARGALASRNDLLLVERMTRIVRRDEIAYALILDGYGRARFHSDVAHVGDAYDSVYAKRALAAKATLVQDIPSHRVLEVDVPLEEGRQPSCRVLRVGFTFKPLDTFSRWLWTGVVLSCACLAAAGLVVFRAN